MNVQSALAGTENQEKRMRLSPKSVICRVLLVALIAIGAGESSQARTIWSGHNSEARTRFQRRSDGRWIETVMQGPRLWNNTFDQVQLTNTFVTLRDSSRNVWVVLYDNRMDIWDWNRSAWGKLYDGGWENLDRYKVRFTRMFIVDDKEGGNGDWRLNATVGSASETTLVNKWEGGTGATLYIRHPKTFTVNGPHFRLSARVFEHDGGIGARWEYVGHREATIWTTGDYHFEFNNSEGHVYVIFRVLSPLAP